MITKELQQLSDKLTGGHTSAHEISKQVDYIEKNYSGGGTGGGVTVFTANGTFDDQQEAWTYSLEDGTTFADIAELATAGEPMFLRVINQYNGGVIEVVGVYPMSKIDYDYSASPPTISAVEFGTTVIYELDPDTYVDYYALKINSDDTVTVISITRTLS